MNTEKKDFLYAPRLPKICTAQEAGWLLGLSEVEVSILVSARLLRPIGDPGKHDRKMFSTSEILDLPPEFPSKARKAIRRHWLSKNSGRRATALKRYAKYVSNLENPTHSDGRNTVEANDNKKGICA